MKRLGTVLSLIGVVTNIIVILPAWMTLLYVILDAVGPPAWAWGLYFAYCPSVFFCTLIFRIGEEMKSKAILDL